MLRIILASLLCAFPVLADQDNSKGHGSLDNIEWGTHWAGTQVEKAADLKGKVTLLVIWGG
jgi:hypothetical protein